MNCALFDLDGTIADTEILKARALALAVESFGGLALPGIYKKVMGRSWEEVTRAFFTEAHIDVPLERFNPIFRDFYSQLIDAELYDKRAAAAFLGRLKSKRFSIGLVSSASLWMIEKALSKLSLSDAFDVIVSNADTDRHKPYPDAYLIALKRLQADSLKAIAFEDSEAGFRAAHSAGLTVYGIRHDFNEEHNFDLCSRTLSSFDECAGWELSGK